MRIFYYRVAFVEYAARFAAALILGAPRQVRPRWSPTHPAGGFGGAGVRARRSL